MYWFSLFDQIHITIISSLPQVSLQTQNEEKEPKKSHVVNITHTKISSAFSPRKKGFKVCYIQSD